MEVKIRKERQETLYRQKERRKKFVEIVLISLLLAAGLAVIVAIIAFIIMAT